LSGHVVRVAEGTFCSTRRHDQHRAEQHHQDLSIAAGIFLPTLIVDHA
jgi:hypothetical protein